MGIPLPKPVMTKIEERQGNKIFRVGSSCVNGFRDHMEDAHITFLRDTYGFFGVFDGHVNDACSAYLAEAWGKVLEKEAVPVSDQRIKDICLQIDQEFLDDNRDGGSTGTFFFAYHDAASGRVRMQVGNVGDSRVLASINGEPEQLTVDHKPNDAAERERIETCGGHVEANRVDGSLALSRAFGDRDYKVKGGDPHNMKVIALADVTNVEVDFDKDDFAVLCCDGVFEGNFRSEEVVEFIAEKMKTEKDLAVIAGMVCQEAVDRGSRDNISCVIVQFTDGSEYAALPTYKVVAGPFDAPGNLNFRKAYEEMAQKGGVSVGALLEQRFDKLSSMGVSQRTQEEEQELLVFGGGPEANLKGPSRTEWFTTFFARRICTANDGEQSARMQRLQQLQMLQQQIGIPLPLILQALQTEADES